MDEQGTKAISGKTYSLFGDDPATDQYYTLIKDLTDQFLVRCPDEKRLLLQLQKADSLLKIGVNKPLISFIKKTLKDSLSVYTGNVKQHLKRVPLRQRFDSIITTREPLYHLYMIEIELTNRIYKQAFKESEYKFALIAHCLRDFRPDCKAESGDVDYICKGCTKECFINIGGQLLKKHDIHPYISVDLNHDKLLARLKAEHPNIGALGIACVPELACGMRKSIKLGIPAIGVPLDANRCSRWMKQCKESSFNLKELEELM